MTGEANTGSQRLSISPIPAYMKKHQALLDSTLFHIDVAERIPGHTHRLHAFYHDAEFSSLQLPALQPFNGSEGAPASLIAPDACAISWIYIFPYDQSFSQRERNHDKHYSFN